MGFRYQGIFSELDSFFDDLQTFHGPRTSFEDGKLVVELPGWKKEDLQISIENGVLTLRGKTQKKSVNQTWNLHPDVDVQGIVGELKDGLLTIELPLKSGAAKKIVTIT